MHGKKLAILALVSLAVAVGGCRKGAPVASIANLPYHSDVGQPLSLTEYENAIVRAGSRRGWTFSKLGPGHLEGRLLVRGKHTAVVDVYFDREEFSIFYKDSENLEYNPTSQTIHPNYNSWVQNLEQDIQTEVQRARVS